LAELPESAAHDEIVGEFDDDPPDDGDDIKDSGYTVNPDVDVEIMSRVPRPSDWTTEFVSERATERSPRRATQHH
jgi:hypothetical protein